MMHILEIPSFFPPYGGLFCLDQSKTLAGLGHTVRILSNVQLGVTIHQRDYLTLPFRRYEHVMDGITVYQSYQRGIPKAIRHNVNHWVDIVCSMYQDYQKKYGRPDILHAHCAKWAGYAAMLISKLYGIPYVMTEHLPKEILRREFGNPPSSAWQIPLLKRAYEAAAMVVTVSKELSDDLSCYYGSDYQHTFISNIIDVDFFAYHPRNRDNSHPFTFCCPAIFVDRKGFDVLFAAFDRLANIASDIRLLVCGHGTDSVKCQRMISNMEHKDKVCCLGELDKYAVRQMYYDSDALVLATRDESQGLVLLEAMSTGIPAISTKAIPQSVRIDSGFKYVDIDDADALMQEMLAAVRNPNDNGYLLSDRVRQFASSGVIGKRLSDLFSDIIALK